MSRFPGSSEKGVKNVTLRSGKKRFSVEVLTSLEVDQLIEQCSKRAPTGRRNRALIILLYRSGLRISEALALLPKDLDLHAGTMVVLHGKGDRRRVLGLDDASQDAIREWLEVRRRLRPGRGAPLFCTLTGRAIDSSYIRRLFPRLGRKAGIEKRVHAHGLRHTMAAELARECLPMNLVQSALGHTSLRTTTRYLDHLAPTEVIERMKRRAWAGHRRNGKRRGKGKAAHTDVERGRKAADA